ncbi:acid-sensing ion channel 4-A isoform X2 [Cololabis saira]|uniref:acid-sensing ion channel 4-A isoform X2 n=1 Tax=Cololabis saira TaxID=129043 RepID=UPI002AD20BFB|nr:acid-sensing ion channel 4-A isoform X2 [Cololabis saira]
MPIEFVCKIKFAEEDEKQKNKQDGNKDSLIEESCTSPTKDLVGFANSCSLHGINHIFVSGYLGIRQTLWTLAFLTSLGLFLYQASKCAMSYLEHPHVTALNEEATPEIVFPAVTICNINRFRFSALTDADIYHLANLTGLPPKNRDGHKPTDLLYPAPDMQDIFNRTGHQLEEMLMSCNFSGQNCSVEDFSVVYTRYGKCYTFNGNKNATRKTKQGGMGNGLEIMLDIQQDEYLPIWRETNETTLEAGIRVQIHSQDEPPYIHQLGFGVSPGFQTFVSCQEQRLTYLPQPWGNCRSTSKETFPGYDAYSISACRLLCETNEVLRQCRCRMVHMPDSRHPVPDATKLNQNTTDPPPCFTAGTADICPPSKIICVDKALAQLQKNSGDTCPCETPCNFTRYGKELSMVKMPSKGSARYLSRKYDKSEDYIRDNFLVLDIFFEALNYETIEQKKAYDVAGLLGDIGGQMGLFVGASILTVLEILDYIYEIIMHRLQRLLRSQKEKNNKQPPSTVATVSLEKMKAKQEKAHYCQPLGAQ